VSVKDGSRANGSPVCNSYVLLLLRCHSKLDRIVDTDYGHSIVTLDLNDVGFVDVDVVRFLRVCQREGVQLLHCSPYIRDWIVKERQS